MSNNNNNNNKQPLSSRAKTISEEHIPLVTDDGNDSNFDKRLRRTKSMPGIGKNEWDLLVHRCGSEGEIDVEGECHDTVQLTNLQASIHIIKASIGTGVLTLPSALKYSGWLLGTGLVFFLSVISIYSMRILLEISLHLRSITDKPIHNLDYEKAVQLCFETSSDNLKKFGWMKYVLYVSLCLAEIGFMSSYHLFVAENIKSFVDYYAASSAKSVPFTAYTIGLLVFLIPLLFIKSLNKLSYVCQLANVLAVLSLLITLIYCFQNPKPFKELKMINISQDAFLAFGLVIFSFESINLINPIENDMKNKQAMLKPIGVLNIATAFVLMFYILIAFFGFWKFGIDIKSSIILSIPFHPWYYMLVKPFYILSIFISYALQGYVMFNIIWKKLVFYIQSEKSKKYIEILLRLSIPCMTTLFATLVPHLDLAISLIGALTGAIITLLIPAICNSVMVYSNKTKFYWKTKLSINSFIFLIGVLGAVSGTYSSISSISKVTKF